MVYGRCVRLRRVMQTKMSRKLFSDMATWIGNELRFGAHGSELFVV
jgi:hypothetical protein